tara:strand:+ start:660 stop:836 length:177 start_codon:yes stop_codon:yes gene_type:complete
MTSPCVNICHLDSDDICQGCFRSSDEIAQWGSLDNEARKEILEKSKDRQLTLNVFKPH